MASRTMLASYLARLGSVFVISALLAGCAAPDHAPTPPSRPVVAFPEPSTWQPLSTTALAITGEITLANNQITFANQRTLKLEPIEQDADSGQTLFRVDDPANPELLNGNLLCGSKPVDYLVVQVSDDVPGQSDMQLMAYYYPEALHLSDLPLKDKDDINRQMCALYTYVGMSKGARAPGS